MNILSVLAVMVAVMFFGLSKSRASDAKGDELTKISVFVCLCLGWWAICEACFFSAPTEELAWYWHRLGAFGWSGFIPVTAYYFLIMGDGKKYVNTVLKQIIFWLPGVVLAFLLFYTNSTAMGTTLIQSTSGLGWTFQDPFGSFWPYIMFVEIIAYLGTALIRLCIWQKTASNQIVQMLSKRFVVLDIISVSVGVILIYILPNFTSAIPPCGFIATAIFYFGYRKLRNSDLTHIEFALKPDSVIENSMDAMLITDLKWNILYANAESMRILKYDNIKSINFYNTVDEDGKNILNEFARNDESRVSGVELLVENHLNMLCSFSKTMTINKDFQVIIISLHDATSLKEAQDKLSYMAHFDELTGLPNRRRLGEMLDQWERKYSSHGQDFSILFLDLNRFKEINDNFGHEAGDHALMIAARALEDYVDNKDIVARLAGDEFIIMHAPSNQTIGELADGIKQTIANIDCSSFAPGVTMSAAIGLCNYSEAGCVRDLFKLADERMYEAKKGV